MALLNWIAAVRELSAPALTVQAQVVDPTLQNRLLWDQFAPRQNVDSLEINTLLEELEVEYTSERRDWNLRGRPIPAKSPGTKRIEMIPIESYFKVEEKEINDLTIRFRNTQPLIQQQIISSIPERTLRLTRANYRRIEKDTFDGWSGGQITRRNPQLGYVAQTFSYGIDTDRYPTASTAWSDPSLNAFDEFVRAVKVADKWVGLCQGAIMRQATWDAIAADATAAISVSSTFPLLRMTNEEIEARLNQELRRQFTIVIFEDTLTVFNDGGYTNTTEVNRWPAEKIGFIPQAGGGAVGVNAFAPVARAYDLTAQAPNAGIDVNGMTVYHEVSNGGREFTVECQVNALFVPFEERIYVLDVGV